MDNYHITKKGDKWQFKKQGTERAINNSDTKTEAVSKMRDYMSEKIGSVKIYKENGRIQEERRYQRKNDPGKSKG